MAGRIEEFFCFDPLDPSDTAVEAREQLRCPILGDTCTKQLHGGVVSGACTIKPVTYGPVICCPVRLYADAYSILTGIASQAFGTGIPLIAPEDVAGLSPLKPVIAVFGKRWGHELRLPQRGAGRGGYYVDWVLALLEPVGGKMTLKDFVAIEVQSIDTTGNYRAEREAYLSGQPFSGNSTVGLNWENVSKRILSQLIYKGHVLRREPLCTKGLFFVCPTPVYKRIEERLGGKLLQYSPQPGSLTFRWYDLGPPVEPGTIRDLVFAGQFTTTIDQVALALSSPSNLPPERVYEEAIRADLA